MSCNCYHTRKKQEYRYSPFSGRPFAYETTVGECWGTKERDECNCCGDESKCNFYPEKRKITRYERLKNRTIEEVADEMNCPYSMCKYGISSGNNCNMCCLEWLNEKV